MNGRPPELIRYLINGLLATAVHFGILSFNLNIVDFASAGFANFIASLFGIGDVRSGQSLSCIPKDRGSDYDPGQKFGCLYGVIAVFHGLVLLLWTDGMLWTTGLGFLSRQRFRFR